MNEEKTESYRALYRVRPLIYHIGDIRLWMPIRQDGVVLWFVYVGVFFIFCYLFPLLSWVLPFDRTITMVVGPIAAAYYTVKLDPAGKSVPRYLRDILHFLVRPKWFVRWQVIRQPGERRKIQFVGRCRPYERFSLKNGIEEWRGGNVRLGGTVEGLQTLLLPANMQVRWRARTTLLTVTPFKRKSKRSVVPPARLEGKARRALAWTTSVPVQVDREKRNDLIEMWKVSKRIDSCENEEDG
ncbi:conjugal transfer protein [Paenibacillus alginolyticus]|uniref:TcpE family conjugal transfer membrane protein n=1 Tax=Paenibacillus alginolyticus TaxID=59839 RepID=UPI000418BCA8|nr:TcpE family conjugal transfer membrane protein [Paenibacillus alginolyticus]MCY9668716.1 conjugal transfer protein [Paenibacillus alginolyticus]